MNYVDGFLLAVPTANKEKYKEYAKSFAPVFKEFGVLSIVECWGDNIPEGEVTSFPMAVKCKADETVVFSWMTWPSKQVRDAAWEKMMKDPRFDPKKNPMPLDGKRMMYGGFVPLFTM